MNTANAETHIPELDKIIKSANRFILIIVLITVLLALPFVSLPCIVTKIENPVPLMQAVLVCSTALMGLSGLIIVEIKKTNIPVPPEDNVFEKVKALNTLLSLAITSE